MTRHLATLSIWAQRKSLHSPSPSTALCCRHSAALHALSSHGNGSSLKQSFPFLGLPTPYRALRGARCTLCTATPPHGITLLQFPLTKQVCLDGLPRTRLCCRWPPTMLLFSQEFLTKIKGRSRSLSATLGPSFLQKKIPSIPRVASSTSRHEEKTGSEMSPIMFCSLPTIASLKIFC